MPSKQTQIHLADLLGKVHSYRCRKDAEFQEQIDQLAIQLARQTVGLSAMQKRLLTQIQNRKKTLADLRFKIQPLLLQRSEFTEQEKKLAAEVKVDLPKLEEKLKKSKRLSQKERKLLCQREPFQSNLQKTESRLGESEATYYLVMDNRPEAERQLLEMQGVALGSTSAWDLVVQEILKKSEIPIDEHRLADYAGSVFFEALAEADELSTEIVRLHDEGVTDRLLTQIWHDFPDVATEMDLPMPPKVVKASVDKYTSRGDEKRPCYDRDHELEEYVAEAEQNGITQRWAYGRDKWNERNPSDQLPKGRSGRDIVREATKKIREERKQSRKY